MAEAQGGDELNQLSCPICLETFQSPKVLTCLHTFCEKCICKNARGLREEGTLSNSIECPVCRSPTTAPAIDQTPEDWAAKLVTNSILLSSLSLDMYGQDDTVYCQPCLTDGKRNISVAYCITCSEYLCNICCDYHKRFKVSKDHSITQQSMPENQVLNETEDRLFRCLRHMKKYTYLCPQDKELCCSRCVIAEHTDCKNFILIENLARSFKDNTETRKVLNDLDNLRKMFQTLLENRSEMLKSTQRQKTEILSAIKEMTVSLKSRAEQLEAVALAELEQVCKQENVAILDHITECKSAIAAVETSKRMLVQGTKSKDDTKNVMTMTRVSQQVRKYLYKYETAVKEFRNINFEFQRDKNFEGIVGSLNSVGHVMSKASDIPGLSSNMSFERTMILLPRIQPDSMVTFNAKVPDDETTCNIYSGIFLSDDRIIVSDEGNKKLKVFDKCFHCVSHLTMNDKPRFICMIDNQKVAVTNAADSIHIVSVTNTLTKLRRISVGIDCYALVPYRQNLIVDTGSGNEDIFLIYDTSYSIIKRIQKPDHSMYCKDTLCVSPDGKTIYYTTKNTIVAIDLDGRKLDTFESENVKNACGITLDKKGIIYYCDQESRTVVQVTPEGRQLGVLLSHDDGLENPIGICLNDKNNMILVFEDESDQVKVFKLI